MNSGKSNKRYFVDPENLADNRQNDEPILNEVDGNQTRGKLLISSNEKDGLFDSSENVQKEKSTEKQRKKRDFKKQKSKNRSKFGDERKDGKWAEEIKFEDDEKKESRRKREFVKIDGVATNFQQRKIHKRRKQFEFVTEHAHRAELLLPEESGCIEAGPCESTCTVTQKELVASVDIASATKHFSLDLKKFGPYRIDYTRNGRYLLLGGKYGHVAAFDWLTKDLLCEINVMEQIRDVKWLHNQMMYAVAQKQYTYLYDSQGTELHCLKMIHNALRLDFLPYHFLLAASCSSSFLHWVDVSIGRLVASFPTKVGSLDVMCQNPANAILHCGQSLGIVSLWSPNVKEPLVKMICHKGAIRDISVEQSGNFMATSGCDKMLKIWDLRTYKPLYEYKLQRPADKISFSQRKLLGCSIGSDIQVFRDICYKQVDSPYMIHGLNEVCTDLQFCPYEDVLGVGHSSGFTSLLVPGSGEPNFDAFEANPFQSKSQRRETEVKALLDKIQPEMITLDSDTISRIDKTAADEVLKDKLQFLVKKRISASEINLKHKAKGKSGSANVQKRKQLVREGRQKDLLNEQTKIRRELTDVGILEEMEGHKNESKSDSGSVLDRFKRKN